MAKPIFKIGDKIDLNGKKSINFFSIFSKDKLTMIILNIETKKNKNIYYLIEENNDKITATLSEDYIVRWI